MSYRGIIHSLILLLAVWSPLNNAIAGAAIIGCPMHMSHTLEQGLHRGMAEPAHHPAQVVANHCVDSNADCSQVGSSLYTQYAQSNCDNSCHCSFCLLLGASALPGNLGSTASFPPTDGFPTVHQAPVAGQHATPFRPPIASLV